MTHGRQHVFAGFLVALTLVALCGLAIADARLDYLINMLETGSNYRVRVQAASTLGKLRATEAVPALVRALSSEEELVVIATATALGQIGDYSVIPDVEKAQATAPSAAAKSQIEATLRVLRALSPNDADVVQDGTPRYLVRIDAMGDSSGAMRKDAVEVLRDIVTKRLKREPGVVVQEPNLSADQVKKKLKAERLTGYIVSGSIIRMEQVDNQLVVKLGLNVFSNPDYNLLMMPTAEGSVPAISGPMARETEREAQDRGLKAVAESLVAGVFAKIRQLDTE